MAVAKQSSQSTSPQPMHKPRWSLRRRLFRGGLLLVVLGLVTPLTWPWFPTWCERAARQALSCREPEQALAWLAWADVVRLGSPRSAESAFLRARAARKLGDPARFQTELLLARNLGCDPLRIEREMWLMQAQSGNLLESEVHVGEMLVDARGDEAEICEAYVNGYILNYRVEEAVHLLDSWSTDFPHDPLPELFRGRIHEHAQRLDEARQAYLKALEIDPKYGPAAYNLGRLALGRQDVAAARGFYEQAAVLLLHPQPAWVGIAHCARLQQQPDFAENWLRKVLASSENDILQGHRAVGDTQDVARTAALAEYAQLLMSQSRWLEAVTMFEKALTVNPRNFALRNLYVPALRQVGRMAEAKHEVTRVQQAEKQLNRLTSLLEQVRKNERDPAPRTELGEIFLKYHSENQGLVWLYSALSVDAHYAPAHAALAAYFTEKTPRDSESQRLAEHHREQVRQNLP